MGVGGRWQNASLKENLDPIPRSWGGCGEIGVDLREIINFRNSKISGLLPLPPHTHPQYQRTAGHVSKYEKKKKIERAAEFQLAPKNYKRQGCLKGGWNVIHAARTKRREGKEHVVPSLGKVPLGRAQASALDHVLCLKGG